MCFQNAFQCVLMRFLSLNALKRIEYEIRYPLIYYVNRFFFF